MRKKTFFKFKNNKGLSLVEAMVALTMIAMISLSVTQVFWSISSTSKQSKQQLELNNLIRIVKENVVQSAKTENDVLGNPNVSVKPDIHKENLQIMDLTGNTYPGYSFDIKYLGKSYSKVDAYEINIKYDAKQVVGFITEVYFSI